ncbi:Uncharacterised protein [Vibrio cholerae]|uniref:Uncharacterized protein n=1 Tax=Vibrio cholerae TaxID=666 RepID=A0A655XH92_VIBCL|nr:Uncharacterised protein [Vibrio cholerae]
MPIAVKLRWKACVKDSNSERVLRVSVKPLGKLFFSLSSLAGGISAHAITVNPEPFLSIRTKDKSATTRIPVTWLCLSITIGPS